MNRETRRSVHVFADWEGLAGPTPTGTLHADLVRGKEVFSFTYDAGWLHAPYAQVIDQHLSLFTGPQYLPEERPNFGAFLDSSPDRWGRVLLRRREAALARMEQRPERTLLETDYLLGVFDAHRMGGLRFKLAPDGPFLDDNRAFAAPPWASIRELEAASLALESDDAIHDSQYLQWLRLLVAPGASLGGARPKASIIDDDGSLWIAKFPSANDATDVGAWELVTHRLALGAGIEMAECRAVKFSGRHHTFLTKRFDRNPSGQRLHFASAMTQLGFVDGQDGASYLDLVDFITTSGQDVVPTLEQLWRRMVFYMAVSNADDHLRNHGFILGNSGWKLSPAYDINPVETANGLHLNITETDNALDLQLAFSVAPHFRLPPDHAKSIAREVLQSIQDWRSIAKSLGISNAECALKSRAFQCHWLQDPLVK
jgi:serine/threonine-protein kinase HipA